MRVGFETAWLVGALLLAVASVLLAADTKAPSVPKNLTATAVSPVQVNLAWRASTDNVAVTGYKVFRNNVQIATTTSTSFSNTGLSPSTPYTYRVASYDAAGNTSAQSNSASATTPSDTQAPTVPAGLTATDVSAAQINLSWSASTDNVAVNGYKVIRNGAQIATTTTAVAYSDGGRIPSTSYSYTVSAYDGAGNNSAQSSPATVTTLPDTQPPAAPGTLSAVSISSSQIDLTWGVSTDNVAVSGYSVYRNGAEVATATSTSYSDAGLSPATSYSYHVVAYDAAANNSVPSNTATASTDTEPDTTAPSVPVNLAAQTISPSEISLTWTSSTDEVGVTGYKVFRNSVQIATTVDTSYSDTGLNPPLNYIYNVSAYDAAANNSEQSAAAFVLKECLGDENCPGLLLTGDPPASGPTTYLAGYADPSIRHSLDGGTLFMTYSYPVKAPTSPGTLAIEGHLAESSDGGTSWVFSRILFGAPNSRTIPGTLQPGVRSSEEISILAAALDHNQPATPYWISVREEYYRLVGQSGTGSVYYATMHLRVGLVQASTPAPLGDGEADEQVILNKSNATWFRNDMPSDRVELSAILAGTGQADCDYPVSPTLHYDSANGYLYLAFMCVVGGTSPEDLATRSKLIVLRTAPYQAGAVQRARNWTWEYRGSFAGSETAALMRANGVPNYDPNMMIQPEFAQSGSTLLLVATPVIHDANGDGRTGCQALEMQSVDPPVFKLQDGQLVRRALINAPDLDSTKYEFGRQTGSCGYEPGATGLGLVMARKITGALGVVTTTLHDTGVRE